MEKETQLLLKKIRTTRKTQGISILNLALSVNISHSHLYYIETMQVTPSIDVVVKIAKALKIELKDFFDNSGESPA